MSVKVWKGVIRNPRAVGWMAEILAKAMSLIVLVLLLLLTACQSCQAQPVTARI